MPEPAPLGVLFDFGGVIWNMRWDVCRGLEVEHGLPPGSLFTTLYRSEPWREVERGRGDREAWLVHARRALEQVAGRALPDLHAEWRAAQGIVAENVALIRTLRPPYRLAVLSNADATLRARLSALPGVIELFDDIVCSAEVGMAKPEPGIYALACDRLGLPPAACVFVDDYEPNVRAAAAAGLRSIHHRLDRHDDLGKQLEATGVVPRPS